MKHLGIRRVAAVLTFFLLWAGVEHCARYFTEPVAQAWPDIQKDRRTVEGTIDTAFVGASLFRDGIIPAAYDAAMGGQSFNYSTSSQSMALSYYALEDLCETNPLKLAVIDISVNRLLEDDVDGVYIAKYALLSHMINLKARLTMLRDLFSLDELPLVLLHTARDQMHFFWGTLNRRLTKSYALDYLRYGYGTDAGYPAGSMGYTPNGGANPESGVEIGAFGAIPDDWGEDSIGLLERVVSQCLEKGVTPVLVSMPTTDAFMLYFDQYEALEAPIKALAEREGILYLDFNLSKFRVDSLTAANFSDEKHMNESGAELFMPVFTQILKEALAGEDVSGYFYASYGAMIRNIDCVAAISCEVRSSEEGKALVASSLHDPLVTPAYSFYIRPRGSEESEYRLLESTGEWCALTDVEPGRYVVRVEAANAENASWDVYCEKTVTVD